VQELVARGDAEDKAKVVMERARTLEAVRFCRNCGSTCSMFDRDGKPTSAYVYDVAVANGALELIADETGMFITRTETGKPGEFDNVTPRRGRREAGGGFIARDMTRKAPLALLRKEGPLLGGKTN